MSKITIRLSGGLGNQLFQYAFGRALSLRSNLTLALDVESGFAGDVYQRSFALSSFHHSGEICARHGFGIGRRIARRLIIANDILRKKRERRILMDPPAPRGSIIPAFDPELVRLKVGHSATVEGYCQSDQYFNDHAGIIKSDLSMRYEPSQADLAIAELIRLSTCPIGMHVRRHRVPTGREDLQISLKFYRDALDFMRGTNPNAQIFIFSDDHIWARNNLNFGPSAIQVNHNNEHGATGDFWLLRQCRNFVLSNSTFSWWAAWLGNHTDKMVIAPLSFYSRQDLVPIEWHRL